MNWHKEHAAEGTRYSEHTEEGGEVQGANLHMNFQ
jgi:hypothetical protein